MSDFRSMVRLWGRTAVLTAALLAAGLVPAAISARGAPGHGTVALTPLEQGILMDVNTVRREHGLPPLRVSPALTAAARQHSDSMAAAGYFSHDSADGSTFWQRLRRFYLAQGFSSWSVGENLLWSSPDVDAAGALDMWLKSPAHRENLLMPSWRDVGIAAVHVDNGPGIFDGRPVTIVTTDFGARGASRESLRRGQQ
jgi:uncharacterized protein YkwD